MSQAPLKKPHSRAWRACKRVLASLAGVLAGILLYLTLFDFPPWLVTMVLKPVNSGILVLEPEAVRLNIVQGITFDHPRVYRKGVVGPPAIRANKAAIRFNWPALLRGGLPFKRVTFSKVSFVPSLLKAPQDAKHMTDKAGPGGVFTQGSCELIMNACSLPGLQVDSFRGHLDVTTNAVMLRDVSALLSAESMSGSVTNFSLVFADGNMRINFESRFAPRLMAGFLSEIDWSFLSDLSQRFDARDRPPDCRTTIDINADGVGVGVHFILRNAAYRDVALTRAEGDVRVDWAPTNLVVSISNLNVTRPEGFGKADFSIDRSLGKVFFDGYSTFSPVALMKLIGIFEKGELDVFSFGGPVRAKAAGSVSYNDLALMDFNVDVESVGLGLGQFMSDNCNFHIRQRGYTTDVTDIKGRIFSGDLAGTAQFVIPGPGESNVSYSINGSLANAQFGRLAGMLDRAAVEYKGRLSAQLDVRGYLGKAMAHTATGTGRISIKDGRVFMLPVFGNFSKVMTKIIPGLDFVLRQNDAVASLTIADGKVSSDNVKIEGDILSLTGKGSYAFDGQLDFDVRVQLMKEHEFVAKLLRAITSPVSMLFQFRLKGTFSEPHWYPVNFSRDILEKLGLTGTRK